MVPERDNKWMVSAFTELQTNGLLDMKSQKWSGGSSPSSEISFLRTSDTALSGCPDNLGTTLSDLPAKETSVEIIGAAHSQHLIYITAPPNRSYSIKHSVRKICLHNALESFSIQTKGHSKSNFQYLSILRHINVLPNWIKVLWDFLGVLTVRFKNCR